MNNYRVCGVYSPEPRTEVNCLRLNFNISKLVYGRIRASSVEGLGMRQFLAGPSKDGKD